MIQTIGGVLVKATPTKKKNPLIGDAVVGFPHSYTVLDLETTGLSPKADHIIEFAAIKVKNGEIIDTFQTLCDPGFDIPPMITSITGITTEMVRNCPNPRKALPDFLDFAGDDFIVGHNVLFDVRFISAVNDGFFNTYIDTMKIFRTLHPTLSHHRLCDMVDFYGKNNESAHRALSDCFATNDCFNAMKDETIQSFGNIESYLKTLK